MKKQIKYRLIMAFIFYAIFSSFNAFCQPWIYGGNAVTATENIGTTTPYDLPFIAGSVNGMTLQQSGDLNINSGFNGYKIDDNYVLWNYGDVTSIFVGDFAGNNTSTSPNANTFWGYGTGNSTFTGSYNSFGGYLSGVSNVYGDSNVFIGNQCGYSNYTGSVNVYIGNMAGFNSNADSNVFIGDQSGYWNSTGYENIFSPDKI